MIFRLEFVINFPDQIEKEVLYVSIPFSTTMHLCPCGCGSEIVNKLSPVRWKITFDGETASLYPSIGNWSLPCQSHYWIRKNEIIWSEALSKKEIQGIRNKQRKSNETFQKKKRK